MLDLNYAKIAAVASIRRAAPLKNAVKSAIVAPQPIQYGFARMFQTLNDNPRINLQVFSDRASAMEWLVAGRPQAGALGA